MRRCYLLPSRPLGNTWLFKSFHLPAVEVTGECSTSPYFKYDGSKACGFYLETGLTWHQANAKCKRFNARLPEIRTKEDNDQIFVLKVLKCFLDQSDKAPFSWRSWSRIKFHDLLYRVIATTLLINFYFLGTFFTALLTFHNCNGW